MSLNKNLQGVHREHIHLKIISNEAGTVQVVMPTIKINMTYVLTPKQTDISITNPGLRAESIGIDNKGIQIISNVDVAVYVIGGDTLEGRANVMSVIPVTDSAKVFVAQSYESYQNDWNVRKSHFIIVATEDLTNVNITLKTASPGNVTYSNMIFKDGDIIRITINRLQTFYAFLFENDLSGSVIKSNKPIVVFSGCDCVLIPKFSLNCDVIESQMTPVSQWGNKYIVPTVYPGRCHIRVYAFHNATHVSVNATFDLTLNQGEFWETTLYGSQAQPFIISGDTVVSVVLYGASYTDGKLGGNTTNPFMLVVPDTNQYSTSASMFPTLLYPDDLLRHLRSFDNYAAIIVLNASFSQLQYNGMALDILQNYSLPNEYTIVIIKLKNVTTHTISKVNTSAPLPLAVFVYGISWYESYGFVAGLKLNYTGKKK